MTKHTDFCKVSAIIRCELLEKVEFKLQEIGVHGYSVTQVMGCGEYTDYFSRDCMTKHAQVQIYTYAHLAEGIAEAIIEAAHTGVEGDGIVAVYPINQVYRVRTRKLLQK